MLRRAAKGVAAGLVGLGAFAAYHAPDALRHWDDIAEVDVDPGSIFDAAPVTTSTSSSSPAAAVACKDCYEIVVPTRDFRGGQVPGFTREAAMIEFVRSFYTAPLFSVERYLIAAASLSLPASVEEESFHVGRKLEGWEVITHQPHGISTAWGDVQGVHGTTNFAVRRGPTAGHMTVRFGSTLSGCEVSAPMLALHDAYSRVLLSQAVATLERRGAAANGDLTTPL